MIPLQPVLIGTIDLTASVAPVIFWLGLTVIVCGVVLALLACDGLRADQAEPLVSGTAKANQISSSSSDLPASGCTHLAA
jgi:hypothetical protein